MRIKKLLPPNLQPLQDKKAAYQVIRSGRCLRQGAYMLALKSHVLLHLHSAFNILLPAKKTGPSRVKKRMNELVRGTFIIDVYGRKFYVALAFFL